MASRSSENDPYGLEITGEDRVERDVIETSLLNDY